MNIESAIRRLESFNFKVYERNGKYSVWSPNDKNNDVDDRYTERELINFAKGYINHKHWQPSVGKYKVGPGGIMCNCCTKMSPSKTKIKAHRRDRRKLHIELKRETDFEDYNDNE